MAGTHTERRVLRQPAVIDKIALSSVSIWRLEKKGEFPRRIKLGSNSVGWLADEIDAWLEQRAAQRIPAEKDGVSLGA